MNINEIENLIAADKFNEALAALDSLILAEPQNARAYYLRGKTNWRLDRRSAAITDYEHAVALDPDSEAAHALTIARDIMDFFNPDMFNP